MIQKHVQDPLAQMILSGQVKDGETITVTAGPSGLMIGDVAVGDERRPAGARLN